MRIAIASGKGGAGKTTVAVNLALVAEPPVQLLDVDVEAPNAHLPLNPAITTRADVTAAVPEVDADRCTACGACGDFCQFNAIAALRTTPLVFAELCHGCGGCIKVCPAGALRETRRVVGEVEQGQARHVRFLQGRLRIGEPMSPPVIRAVLQRAGREPAFIDAPPGTACAFVAAVHGADYVVLVAEPTPFGLHDMQLAWAGIRKLGRPCGVVVNRVGMGDDRVQQFCAAEGLEVLGEIPHTRAAAEVCARGQALVDELPEMRTRFTMLHDRVVTAAAAAHRQQTQA